jgi:transcription elongation factor Elf1
MRFLPLTIRCPACGSGDVVYSCTPDCCFNHVCNACLNSFELATKDLGESLASGSLETQGPDSCEPTVSCARCGSLKLLMMDEGVTPGRLACSACNTLLELEFVEG